MIKKGLVVGVIVLFILSVFSPLVIGFDIDSTEQSTDDKGLLQEYYGCYSLEEIPESIRPTISKEEENRDILETDNIINSKGSPEPLDGLMDSAWPMYCHDTRHTGRSPYSTVDTWDEIWRFEQHKNYFVLGSPIVGDDGTIYFGGLGDFYALHPNGTLKWKYDGLEFYVWSAPAIDENGVIYVGDNNGYFHAINPDGTKKWKIKMGSSIWSSPAIDDDGTIYIGDSDNWYIKALYPNGTVKWKYKTGLVVYSSPAIGQDGTVYCGSHDEYLYALYPNNGTLKWRYKTGHWIRTSPCIGDDGTIYVVSLDDYLHAVNLDGTQKWKRDVGGGTSPTIGHDGTIYCGYSKLCAINPNGSVKWKLDVAGNIKGSTPCHSLEDTIYFGTDTGWLYAVYPDGTLKFQEKIANEFIDSAPAIGSDGTVYVGSAWDVGGYSHGYLHAFGEFDPDAPSAPDIDGPLSGNFGIDYEYIFKSISPFGRDVYYYIEWGDGKTKDWFGPFGSGEEVTASHKWSQEGTFTIRARARDTDNLWGSWGELEVYMPRDKATNNMLFWRLLERFPLLWEVLIRLNPR